MTKVASGPLFRWYEYRKIMGIGCVTPPTTNRENTPDRIRTCDLSFRKAALYPTELRGHIHNGYSYFQSSFKQCLQPMTLSELPKPMLPTIAGWYFRQPNHRFQSLSRFKASVHGNRPAVIPAVKVGVQYGRPHGHSKTLDDFILSMVHHAP
jgi:hypothetical protein